MTNTLARLLALAAIVVYVAALSGCGSKEEASPGGNYYDGPMKPKGGGGGAPE